MTAAAAIGLTAEEISTFLKRLDKTFSKFQRQYASELDDEKFNKDLENVSS